jgi:hypothetical protein
MRIAFVVAAGLVLAHASPAEAQLAGGFSLQQGRATPADLRRLRADAVRLINAEGKFLLDVEGTGKVQLGVERQKQLTGTTEDPENSSAVEDLARGAREWWVKNELQPTLDILANPAASCALATSMLERMLTMERQAQLLGVEGLSFGDLTDPGSILGQAVSLARYRCLAEAFDECMATGNGQALILALSKWGRQIAIISGETHADWEQQVTYLFRRCTVYTLTYRSQLRDRKTPESSVAHGSFILLFHPQGEGIVGFSRGDWRPRPQDLASPDVWLTNINCGPAITTCRQKTEGGVGGAAWGVVLLQRDMSEQTFQVVPGQPKPPLETTRTEGRTIITDRRLPMPGKAQDPFQGAWTILRTIRHREGKDSLSMNFGPPLVQVQAFSAGHGGNVELPDANGTGLFYIANGKEFGEYPLAIDGSTWVHGTFPKLYITAHSASANSVDETTHFELFHRPDLFPADEYVPSLELTENPKAPRIGVK